MNDIALENLCNAIIIQAAKDYREALRKPRVGGVYSGKVKTEVERFFRSHWYTMLTDLDGEVILEGLRNEEI